MITGIILASGFSKRIDKEKLLLDVGGIPMVERVIRAAQSSLITEGKLLHLSRFIRRDDMRYELLEH